MIPKISACAFIRDNISGAFCLFESMATLMPFADEYVIMDFGSTDGTLEILQALALQNSKIRIVLREVKEEEKTNKIFATMANELIQECRNDIILYHQADEIWHEELVEKMREELERLEKVKAMSPQDYVQWKGMNFWRYQLRNNFQTMKWWPHPVNRLDFKHRMNFVGDGMNTDRPWDAPFVGAFDGGWGPKWEKEFKPKPGTLPTQHMILDVSMEGGFLDNIPERRRKHAPFWGESDQVLYIDGHAQNLAEWYDLAKRNPAWERVTSPFNLPAIMRGLVGNSQYSARPGVLRQIVEG